MNPPKGSKIRIESKRGYEKIIAPHGSGGVMRYLIGLFLLAWLAGWAFGWVAAFSALVSGEGEPKEVSGFLLFWLIAWTAGGAFAFWFLFRVLRPSVPEELILNLPSMVHDSGVPAFTISFDYQSQMDMWKKMLKRRKTTEFNQQDIQTLRLREVIGGNRLTIDKGVERTDLGTSLSEIEREWLFVVLSQKYKVEQGRGANALSRVDHD